MKHCLGSYEGKKECASCVLLFFCIDTTIKVDAYFDSLASRQQEIEEMESDANWRWHESEKR